jgi:hypothetical protein
MDAEMLDTAPELNGESEIDESTDADMATEDTEAEGTEDGHDDYYSSLAESDVRTLKDSFRELKDLKDLTELENPMRFALLRDAGYSAVEAYLESSRRKKHQDNRSHLYSSVPISRSKSDISMTREEMEMARDLFPDISDSEIQKLYKSVTR